MNGFAELYTKSVNPLDNNENLKRIVKSYNEAVSKYGEWIGGNVFYNDIQEFGTEEKEKKKDYPREKENKLMSGLFNFWKRNVLRLQYSHDIDQNYDRHFREILEILNQIPDIKTTEDVKKINEKFSILKDFGFKLEDQYWTHIKSSWINGKRERDMGIEYRLYINSEVDNLYDLIKEFTYECLSTNTPFYYKFPNKGEDTGNRADSIVIYSDEENLFKHIQMLNNIKARNPDFVASCRKPPILTIPINEWIGFGQEPFNNEESYTSIRSDLISKSIKESLIEWIRINAEAKEKVGNQSLSIKNYIIFDSIKSEYIYHKDTLTTDSCKKVYDTVKDILIPILEEDKLITYTKGKEKITFSFRKQLNKICSIILKSEEKSNAFFGLIRKNIRNNSEKYRIDGDKFGFNSDFREKINYRIGNNELAGR